MSTCGSGKKAIAKRKKAAGLSKTLGAEATSENRLSTEAVGRIAKITFPKLELLTWQKHLLESELNKALLGFSAYLSRDSVIRRAAWTSLATIERQNRKLLTHLRRKDMSKYIREMIVEAARLHAREAGGHPKLVEASGAYDRCLAILDLLGTWTMLAQQLPRPEPHDIAPEVRLIGGILPYIYKEVFDRPFGLSKSVDQAISGPGLRFISSVLDEANIRTSAGRRYSPETIAKYCRYPYSRARKPLTDR